MQKIKSIIALSCAEFFIYSIDLQFDNAFSNLIIICMKWFSKHKKFIIAVIVIIIVLAMIIAGIAGMVSPSPNSSKTKSTKDNLALSYIKTAEAVDISPIEDTIFENNRQRLIYADEIAQEKLFQNLAELGTVIFGDSRAEGFSVFGFMDSSRVFSGVGWGIYNIPNILPKFKALNPRNIVVSCGLNEIPYQMSESDFANSNERYVADTSYYLGLIKEQHPDANIYLTSIVSVQDFVVANRSGYAIIPSRNKALEKMCDNEGYTFIDMTAYCKANSNLYGADGMHFFPDFYPGWGRVLLNSITQQEGGGNVDSMEDNQVWATLEQLGVVIAGDSRGAEFSAFGFYPQYLNFSGYSKTIYNIPEIYDKVASSKPRILILCYGVNDLGLYGPFGVEKYMNDFQGFIDKLKEISPNTKIYVNSIPPSLASEYERAPSWALSYSWNDYNEAYCKEHGINYINVTKICNEHEDLYRSDGVHFMPDFYPLWARTILKEIFKNEN